MTTRLFAAFVLLVGCGEVQKVDPDATAGSDDASSDGDMPSDGSLTTSCDDTFGDTTIDPVIWTLADPDNTPVVVAETGDHLRITVPSHSGGTSLGGNALQSKTAFSFTSIEVQVEALAIPTDPETQVYFQVGDATKSVGFSMYGNTHIHAGINGAGNTVAFSPTNDRHWRIRESGGMVTLETGPDKMTWTTRYSATTPAMTSPQIRVGAGLDVGPGGIFEVDNIAVHVAGGATCPLQ